MTVRGLVRGAAVPVLGPLATLSIPDASDTLLAGLAHLGTDLSF